MTANTFYSFSLVVLLNIQKYLREREQEVTPPTIHTVVSSVQLHWHLKGIFDFILRLRLQIEFVVIVVSDNCEFENGLFRC